MESTRELNFEELTLLLDLFAREYAATGNAHRRREIAIEISELTARISAVRSRRPLIRIDLDCAPPAGQFSPGFEGNAISSFCLLNSHLVFLRG